MPERKTMAAVSRIVDDDTGLYRLGEIDGSFNESELAEYLKAYKNQGYQNLISRLSFMQYQVVRAWYGYIEDQHKELAQGQNEEA